MARKVPSLRVALTVATAGIVLTLVPAAVAARPGSGGTTSTATIVSDCNPCALGTIAHFTGSGYDPTEPRGMAALRDSAGNTTWIGININSNGTTSFELYMSPAGTYNLKVLQNQRKKLVLKAELANLVIQ